MDYENSRNPFPERRAFVEHLAQSCGSTVEPDDAIRVFAGRLAGEHAIQGRDALHLACAELSGCDYLVTCDDRLIRQGERMRKEGTLSVQVINPVDLAKEV